MVFVKYFKLNSEFIVHDCMNFYTLIVILETEQQWKGRRANDWEG